MQLYPEKNNFWKLRENLVNDWMVMYGHMYGIILGLACFCMLTSGWVADRRKLKKFFDLLLVIQCLPRNDYKHVEVKISFKHILK